MYLDIFLMGVIVLVSLLWSFSSYSSHAGETPMPNQIRDHCSADDDDDEDDNTGYI